MLTLFYFPDGHPLQVKHIMDVTFSPLPQRLYCTSAHQFFSLCTYTAEQRGSGIKWKQWGFDCHWLGIILFGLPSEAGPSTNKQRGSVESLTFPFSLSHPALGCLFISIDSCSFRCLWSGVDLLGIQLVWGGTCRARLSRNRESRGAEVHRACRKKKSPSFPFFFLEEKKNKCFQLRRDSNNLLDR